MSSAVTCDSISLRSGADDATASLNGIVTQARILKTSSARMPV